MCDADRYLHAHDVRAASRLADALCTSVQGPRCRSPRGAVIRSRPVSATQPRPSVFAGTRVFGSEAGNALSLTRWRAASRGSQPVLMLEAIAISEKHPRVGENAPGPNSLTPKGADMPWMIRCPSHSRGDDARLVSTRDSPI